MRTLLLVFVALGVATLRIADADDGAAESKMVESGAAVPTVGGDVRGQRNSFDMEFVTTRFSLRSPDKTLTTLTVAPFLTPQYKYKWWLSETRIGVHVENSGAFGVGLAWGYNSARRYLADTPLDTCDTTLDKELKTSCRNSLAAQREAMATAVDAVCDRARTYTAQCATTSLACTKANVIDQMCRNSTQTNLAVLADQLTSKLKPPARTLNHDKPELYTGPTAADEATLPFRDAYITLTSASMQYVESSTAAKRKADDHVAMKSRAERLTQAYAKSIGVNLYSALGGFPITDAPEIAPMAGKGPGEPRDAFSRRLRNFDLGGAVRFYPARTVLLQGRGGYRWDRTAAMEGTPYTAEYYVGVDLAGMYLWSTPDQTGFQPGIGGGITALFYSCREAGGCTTELGLGDEYPKTAPLEKRGQLSGFVEWRPYKEFQVRLTVDIIVDSVKGQIMGTRIEDVSPRLFHVVPSISVGSSFWRL